MGIMVTAADVRDALVELFVGGRLTGEATTYEQVERRVDSKLAALGITDLSLMVDMPIGDRQAPQQAVEMVRRYEDSVLMPEDERATFVDSGGRTRLKSGLRQSAYELAARAERYLEFGRDIERVLAGSLARGTYVNVGATPPPLVMVGLEDETLAMSQRQVLRELTPRQDGGYGVAPALLRRLPELLQRPAYIYEERDHPGSVVAILGAVDDRGWPVIMPIVPEVWSGPDGRQHVNNAKAAYGRHNWAERLFERTGPEGMLYYDIERAKELDALAGRQLPRSHELAQDHDRTILHPMRPAIPRPEGVTTARAYGAEATGHACPLASPEELRRAAAGTSASHRNPKWRWGV